MKFHTKLVFTLYNISSYGNISFVFNDIPLRFQATRANVRIKSNENNRVFATCVTEKRLDKFTH